MFAKHFRILLPLLTVAGCQSAGPTAHPAGLEARLSSLEQSRLPRPEGIAIRRIGPVTARPDVVAGSWFSVHSSGRVAQSPSGDGWRGKWASLALSEMGDPDSDEKSSTSDTLSLHEDDSVGSMATEPPLDSLWDTIKRDVRQMPGDLWRDTKTVYANPVNLAILGVGFGASLTLQETGPDDTVEDHFRGHHHHFGEDWRDGFGAAGNPGTHFALAGLWYLAGQQMGDTKTYEVGKTMFSALIINGLTVMVGQAASSDRSPNGEWGTFPSGHTSSSFVMASVLHHAYGHVVGIPLYGLATLVAMERVEDGEHYLSDVVMGAVLGTVIGHAVADGRDPEIFGWKVIPYASMDSGRTGIALAKTFK